MDILLTGSVAYDYLMTFPGHFKEQILPERLASISLSFLVDSMSKQRGCVAPNIAYTMALLGERPRVMATVGEDFEDYRAWLEAKGVDTTLMCVISGVFTASFFATTTRSANCLFTRAWDLRHSISSGSRQLNPISVIVRNAPTRSDEVPYGVS
jgi:adenosine kinase